MSQTGRQQADHLHGYLHGVDDCRHCDLHLANVEELVEQDLSKDKNGGARSLRWCQIYDKESLKMEGEFGDKFLRFLELPVLLDCTMRF